MIEHKDGRSNKNQELSYEIEVGVTFASFMSAATLFFTGLLLAQFKSFDPTIKVALLFLIISTFTFIFSASIYSNAGVEVTRHKFNSVQKYLSYANNIFEFLGLYLFILATPLVIGSVTNDSFLRISTILIALIGLALYSRSDFSILHKELLNKQHKRVITTAIVVLGATLYASQGLTQLNNFPAYDYIAGALLILIFSVTLYFCRKSKQYAESDI